MWLGLVPRYSSSKRWNSSTPPYGAEMGIEEDGTVGFIIWYGDI